MIPSTLISITPKSTSENYIPSLNSGDLVITKEDLDLKLRFLMGDKSEYIVGLLLQKFIVNNIDLKVLFERNKIPVSMMGVVQFECCGVNPEGVLLTLNRINNTISADHFTGG